MTPKLNWPILAHFTKESPTQQKNNETKKFLTISVGSTIVNNTQLNLKLQKAMSFSRELIPHQCQANQQQTERDNKITTPCSTMQPPPVKPMEVESCNNGNVFNSIDFSSFLRREFPVMEEGSSPFLSKDFSIASFDVPSVFKSKDTFSPMFSSNDWQPKLSNPGTKESGLPPTKPIPAFIHAPTATETANTRESLRTVLSSIDWMGTHTLGPHIDVSIHREMLLRNASTASEHSFRNTNDLSAAIPPARTDWESVFFAQMQLIPPQDTGAKQAHSMGEEPSHRHIKEMLPSGATALVELKEHDKSPPESPENDSQSSAGDLTEEFQSSQPAPKKRKRKPRKKVIPDVKIYVQPTENDVLLGRGGRSNHHTGNKRYRDEVRNLRTWYASIGENKDEKTALSQCLVDYVHGYKGRFLEKDKSGWFEVPNIVARRKASQALREDDDPEKRAAKRSRFLKKKSTSEDGDSLLTRGEYDQPD